MRRLLKFCPLALACLVVTALPGSAQNWHPTSAPITNWTALAASSDGTRLVATADGGLGGDGWHLVARPGPIFLSTNSGTTWAQATGAPLLHWTAVASSADGSRLLAAAYGEQVYSSSDAGLTWTRSTAAPRTNWTDLACSADGTRWIGSAMAVIYGSTVGGLEWPPFGAGYPPPHDMVPGNYRGAVYISSDAGATWRQANLPATVWRSVASSADGSRLAAAATGNLFWSTDAGHSWTGSTTGSDLFQWQAFQWLGVAFSADGQRLGAGRAIGQTFISPNSGGTWIPANGAVFSLVCSADGTRWAGLSKAASPWGGAGIYNSANGGNDWYRTANPSDPFTRLATSADGTKLFALAQSGKIYAWQETAPAPPSATTLAAQGATGNLTLNGRATPNGAATAAWFQWGRNAAFGLTSAPTDAGTTWPDLPVSTALTEFTPGSNYLYRLVATNAVGTAYGQTRLFQSPALLLQGSTLLAQYCYQAFTDPGVRVTGAPLGVAAGASHCLVLKSDGTVVAWGNNEYGQLQVPTTATNLVAIAAGSHHAVGLRADGGVVAWGGQGTVDRGQSLVPAGVSNAVAVTAGAAYSLALLADGTIRAWGDNSSGQAEVPPDATNVVQIAAGSSHVLALRADGTLLAWGSNGHGETAIPAEATHVVAVAAGEGHSLALTADGRVLAWGNNLQGQTTVPAAAFPAIAVAAGKSCSFVLDTNGNVIAWGDNSRGQTTPPASAQNLLSLHGCGDTLLALRTDGTVVAWGVNDHGQLAIPDSLQSLQLAVTVQSGSSGYQWPPLLWPPVRPLNTNVPGTYNIQYSSTNVLGIGSSVQRTITILGALQVKTALCEEVDSARTNRTLQRLDVAVDHLRYPFTRSLWLSDNRVARPDGALVFRHDLNAISRVMGLQRSRALRSNLAENWIRRIVISDRLLALGELEAARSADPSISRLAGAAANLARGDRALAAGRYASAILYYADAWRAYALRAQNPG